MSQQPERNRAPRPRRPGSSSGPALRAPVRRTAQLVGRGTRGIGDAGILDEYPPAGTGWEVTPGVIAHPDAERVTGGTDCLEQDRAGGIDPVPVPRAAVEVTIERVETQ